MPFTEDLAAFFDVAGGFASSALYDGTTTITGIFDDAHELAALGMAMQAAAGPQFLCRAADVAADPVGKSLVVNGITYSIAEHQPDGTGMTTLILKRSA